jgi:hypothetical protein
MPDRSKISSLSMLVLFAFALFFALLFYFGRVVPGTEGTPVEEPLVTDEVIVLAYVYFGIALFSVIVFAFFEFLQHPQNAKRLLISFAAFVVLFGMGFLMANNKTIPGFNNPSNTMQTVRWVDAGLKSAYLFIGLAVIGVIYTEIAGMLRSN